MDSKLRENQPKQRFFDNSSTKQYLINDTIDAKHGTPNDDTRSGAKKEWDGKHRGGKDFDDDEDTQKELQDSKKGDDDDDYDVDKEISDANEEFGDDDDDSCPTCGKPHKVVTSEDIENIGRRKSDGSATTSTVGVANFVYSDVEEAKKQKDSQ